MNHRFSNHANKSSLLAFVDRVAMALTTTTARAQLRTKVITVAVLAVLGLSLIACGGSSTPAATVTSVTVTATASAIAVNGTLTFTPTVTGTGSPSQAVTWACTGGTVSSANVYTAPATAGNYTCTATSAANTSVSSTAIPVTVVGVSISAPITTVAANGTLTFTATVAPTGESQAVTWSCTRGTITSAGVYTAPATTGSDTCTAASTAVTTATATTPTITVTAAGATSVTVSGSTSVYATQTDQLTATVVPTGSPAVVWSIQEGATGGTITTGGLYTAPAAAGTYHVIATSGTKASTPFAITVTIPNPTFTSVPTSALTLAQATTTYTYTAAATDPAGTAITYSLTAGPAAPTASIVGTTGAITWGPVPPADRVMPSTFTVKATTALGGTASETWIVTPLRAVTMTLIDNFWASAGALGGGPSPLSGTLPVGARVPGSTLSCTSGTATLNYCGVDNGDGTYTINNVPAGYYWLVSGPTEEFWTNVNTFDDGTDYVGQQLDGNATAMTLDIASPGLTISPYVSGDAIWIGSPNFNSWYNPTTPPAASSTTYIDTTDSIPALTLPALTAADSYILQYDYLSPANASYIGLGITVDQVEPSTFAYTSLVSGALTATSPTTTDLTMGNWPAMVPPSSAEPGGNTGSATFFGTYLWAQPYTTPPLAAIGGGMPSCIMGSATAGCGTNINGWPSGSGPEPATIINAPRDNRLFGSPGPVYAAWAERCQTGEVCEGAANAETVTLSFSNPFTTSPPFVLWSQQENSVFVPGYTTAFVTYPNAAIEFSSAPTTATVAPAINPVASATINGADLFTTSSPTKPLVLSWAAATVATGAPTGAMIAGYDVLVYAVPTSSGGAWGSPLAKLYTPTPTATVPSGLLPAGTYVFVIESIADAGANVATSPFRSAYPTGRAQVVSAPITITGS